MLIFLHRLCFMFARAIAILGVPIAVLLIGGEIHDYGHSVDGYLRLVGGVLAPVIPLLIFKFVLRVGCPNCGHRLDREMIGAGNYDCRNCGRSYS